MMKNACTGKRGGLRVERGVCGQMHATRGASKTRDVKPQDTDDISKGASHFTRDSALTQKSHSNGRCANVRVTNPEAMVIAIHPASFLIFQGRLQQHQDPIGGRSRCTAQHRAPWKGIHK